MAANVQAIFQAVLFIASLAILGVVIANLVTTINIQNGQSSTPVNLNLNISSNNPPNTPLVFNNTATYYNYTIYNNTIYNTSSVVYYQPASSSLNLSPVPTISNTSDRYSSFQNFARILSGGLNVLQNPCTNFYEYTCSNIKTDISFGISDDLNTNYMIQGLTSQAYRDKSQNSTTLKSIFYYYDQCVVSRKNWDSLIGVRDGGIISNVIQTIGEGLQRNNNETTFPFPMLDQTSAITDFPTPIGIAYLSSITLGTWGIPTFVSAYTDTKWSTPEKGYALLIDQPTTFYPNTYYLKDADNTRSRIINEIQAVMNAYTAIINVTLDQDKLFNDATNIAKLDFILALNLSTDDTTRRQFGRSNVQVSLADLMTNYSSFSWLTYLPITVQASFDALNIVHDKSTRFTLMEGDKLGAFLAILKPNNVYGITPNDIVNYVYYAAVRQNVNYFPGTYDSEHIVKSARPFTLPRRQDKRRGIVPERKDRYARKQMMSDSEIAASCASETMDVLQYANARVFIDQIYPNITARPAMRAHVAKVANSILIGMRSMIDQLDWMSSQSKVGAYSKIEKLTKNMAYPDFITDDAQLDAYHNTLGFDLQRDEYLNLVDKANTFGLYKLWQVLNATSTARDDFAGPPGTTNAWYQDELNSITFPAGILHPPFYDVNWPAAVNFGAMGVIAGHELTHGFDDQGVQWDGTGALNSWMNDQSSKDGFHQMAQCVIDEYSNFCPLNKTVYGKAACVDGQQTQGENIADNGGIHSAYRAYKNYISFNGPDPKLPDDTLGNFTPDQLFFLSFAQVWCQTTPTDARFERQILVDVHSPSIYRVFGTIQNFPAFRSAFNCPADSPYGPTKHCNVWVSDINSNYGIPKM